MKINMYSVAFKKAYPVKVGKDKTKDVLNYGFPFYAKDLSEARDVACRSFLNKVANTEDAINVDPADFTLYQVGTFEPTSDIPFNRVHKCCGTIEQLLERGYGKEVDQDACT